MLIKRTQKLKLEKKKEKARKLYAFGLTTREIGKIVKRSHAWVAMAVKDTPVDKSPLTQDLQVI